MALPHDFTIRTKQWLGADYNLLESALQEEPPVSIRLNPAKQAVPVAGYEKVKWCDTGYYLPERPSFTFDPLFHAGCYYVQDASSMFLEQVVKQYITTPVVCLDLCAAPGGKSTHLQSLLPDNSLVVSNEVIRRRANILKENIIKWGLPYSVVTCNDPKEIGRLTHLFDMIVADVPCSGEGMFRKDTQSRNEWSVANVQLCAARQRRIIHDVWQSLKPGGLLVYSTCTFNREENEENIRHLIEHYQTEALPVSVTAGWQISPAIDESFHFYRFYPHKTKGEGFCLAVLKKPEVSKFKVQGSKFKVQGSKFKVQGSKFKVQSSKFKIQCPKFSFPQLFNYSIIQSCLSPQLFNFQLFNSKFDDSFHCEINRDTIQALPSCYQETYELLKRHLHVIHAGIFLGEIKGKDFIPSTALALNIAFHSEAFPSVELSLEESIRYLQKEALVLPENNPTGFVVVKYQTIPLGFVKNIGSRANNLYPQEWRIRK